MSGHAETRALLEEIRYESNLSRATAALDALLAENQRLREALNKVVFVSPFNSQEYQIAREALAGDGQ